MSLQSNIPLVKSAEDAGFDIRCAEDTTFLAANTPWKIRTGLRCVFPPGYYGQIWPRSGLSAAGITVYGGGIVDQGYTGEIVVVMSSSREGAQIAAGDHIAQLVIVPIYPAVASVVPDDFDAAVALSASARGSAGFGSTGR